MGAVPVSAALAPGTVLVLVAATPHHDDTCSSLFRLVDAVLAAGRPTVVWACGWATALTAPALGARKPRDLTDWRAEHPTTAALVAALRAEHGERLRWLVCRFCGEQHGTAEQPDHVELVPSHRMAALLAAADRALVLGDR